MEVSLVNFCKYEQLSFTLPATGIYCITGETGVGKTTLLRAIVWCITGEGVDVIRHNAPQKAKMSVTLTFNGITIYRQKRSELLQITLADNVVYTDAQAEAQIQQIFGSPGLWLASTYLAQKEDHPLVSLNAKERLDLIQQAALSMENPSRYLDAVSAFIKQLHNSYSTDFNYISTMSASIAKEMQTLDFNLYCLPEARTDKLAKLSAYPTRQAVIRQKIAEHNKMQGMITSKRERLKLLNPSPVDEAKIVEAKRTKERFERLKSDWDKYLQNKKIMETRTSLEQELAALNNNLSAADYTQIVALGPALVGNINKWSQHSTNAAKLGIEYNKATIDNYVNKCLQLQNTRRYEDLKNKIKLYQAQHDAISYDVNKIIGVDRDQLQKDIYTANTINLSLECPHCKSKLKLDNHNKLEMVTQNIVNNKPILQLKQILAEYDENLTRKNQKDGLAKSIEDLTKSIPVLPTIDELRLDKDTLALNPMMLDNKITALRALEVMDKPIFSLEQVNWATKITACKSKLTLFSATVGVQPELPLTEIQTELELINKNLVSLNKHQAEYQEYNSLNKSIQELEQVLTPVEGLEQEYEQISAELAELNKQVAMWPIFDNLVARQGEIETRSVNLKTQEQALSDWNTIYQVMVNEEYQILEQTVGTINFVLSDVVGKLFTNVGAEIMLYKQNKVSHSVKPEINLCVKRSIDTGESVEVIKLQSGSIGALRLNSLSGGEKSRLNLALLLAFRTITRSSFLFLDESLAFLNDDYCDTVHDIIRDHLIDVPGSCFSIMHRVVTGEFDGNFVL